MKWNIRTLEKFGLGYKNYLEDCVLINSKCKNQVDRAVNDLYFLYWSFSISIFWTWFLIMIMMMGLIITMRTSDNGTLNCICRHTTQTIACFYVLQDVRALGGADCLTEWWASRWGDVERGLTLTGQDGCPFAESLAGCTRVSPGKSLKLVLGINIQLQQIL